MDIQRCAARQTAQVPLILYRIAAGFPSPADDYLERPLDFNELLITHPAATFAVRVQGDSMTGAGIFPGDIAVVDRSLTASDGDIIVALLDGGFTLKRLRKTASGAWLEAANSTYPNLPLTGETSFEVWGVVKHSIRMFHG